MFTLVALYILIYILVLISMLSLTINHISLSLLSSLSFNNFIIFIQKFKTIKNIYLWLFFSLTGLPPVGLFFVKFNIFFSLLNSTHAFSSFIIFFFFFLNMLFYCQIFFSKNYKKNLYKIIAQNTFGQYTGNQEIYFNFSSYTTYKLLIFIVNTLLFIVFSSIFISDYYLVIYCFSVNNKSKSFF